MDDFPLFYSTSKLITVHHNLSPWILFPVLDRSQEYVFALGKKVKFFLRRGNLKKNYNKILSVTDWSFQAE